MWSRTLVIFATKRSRWKVMWRRIDGRMFQRSRWAVIAVRWRSPVRVSSLFTFESTVLLVSLLSIESINVSSFYTHTGQNYECNLCGRTFIRDSYLIRHHNRVHRDRVQTSNINATINAVVAQAAVNSNDSSGVFDSNGQIGDLRYEIWWILRNSLDAS